MDDKEKTGKKQNILAGFLEFFYGNFVVLLMGFISLPLLTRILSTDEYGRSNLFLSAVSIIYIFAILGLDQSYIRYFYSEGVDERKLFGQCLKAPLVLIVVLSGVYLAFSGFFNSVLFGKGGFDVTILVIAYTLTSVFERFLFLNIRMQQRGKLYSNLNILSKVLNIIFIVLFAYLLGDDFRVGLYAQTLPLVVVTAMLLVMFAYSGRGYKAKPHSLTEKELLRVFIRHADNDHTYDPQDNICGILVADRDEEVRTGGRERGKAFLCGYVSKSPVSMPSCSLRTNGISKHNRSDTG